MRVILRDSHEDVSQYVANAIRAAIHAKQAVTDRPFVLGLPTAASPKRTFALLRHFVKEGSLSFKNVVCFNMDDYVGVPVDHPESFHLYMREQLFDHVDCPAANINLPNGNAADLEAEAERYEAKIKSYGGIDLFLCGVGVDGHLAFNEPGSSLTSRARVKTLSHVLLETHEKMFAAHKALGCPTPTAALTVGVGTIMESKSVIVIMTGANKALAVEQILQGSVSQNWPITALQNHPNVTIGVDKLSSMELKARTIEWYKQLEAIDNKRKSGSAAAGAAKVSPAASSSVAAVYLAGDIGATNARLQLRKAGADDVLIAEATYLTRNYPTLSAVLQEFLRAHGNGNKPQAMCLAVAGPVANNRCRITNLSWEFDGSSLAREFSLSEGAVTLVNDFVAVGWGVLGLSGDEDIELLYEPPNSEGKFQPAKHLAGDNASGVKAVIGAGTGLGSCYLTPNGNGFGVHASEGGHADWAARSAEEHEFALWLSARDKLPRVSVTRVVSGVGLAAMYRFFQSKVPSEANASVAAQVAEAERATEHGDTVDVGALIASAAANKECAVSQRAMHLFAQVYGGETGNVALRLLPSAGMYVVGGIAVNNLATLRANGNQFNREFLNKGRLTPAVSAIPVYLVKHANPGLLGAGVIARKAIQSK